MTGPDLDAIRERLRFARSVYDDDSTVGDFLDDVEALLARVDELEGHVRMGGDLFAGEVGALRRRVDELEVIVRHLRRSST